MTLRFVLSATVAAPSQRDEETVGYITVKGRFCEREVKPALI